GFSVRIEGLDALQGRIRKFAARIVPGASEVTDEYADRLVEQVKSNASGRPGPNIITGAYRSSIYKIQEDKLTVGAASDAPQAARLEFGFTGIDALGRSYDQPPFPHWMPAVDVVRPEYYQAMVEAVRKWW